MRFSVRRATTPRNVVHAFRDRMIERYDTTRVVRDKDYQYIRNFMPHRSWSQFVSYTEEMPTMKVWRRLAEQQKLNPLQERYFYDTKPIEELYDTAADPHQVNNLATDPKYATVVNRMRQQSIAWMKETHDLGLLPEYEILRRATGRTPYEVAHDPQLNPLNRLLEAADLANQMNPKNISGLIELLRADDPAIRYWGAVGLVALREKSEPARDALLKSFEDSAPNVRIAAAEALCHIDQLDRAMPILIDGLNHDSAFIRLRTMNVLDRLGERARPALPAIRVAGVGEKSDVGDYLGRMVEYLPRRLDEVKDK